MRLDITEFQITGPKIDTDVVLHFKVDEFKYLQPYDEKLIRFGSREHYAGDGGYIIPEILLQSKIKLISFGIGDNCDFEIDWYKKISKDIVAYCDGQDEIEDENIFDDARLIKLKVDDENIFDIIEQEANVPFFIKMDIEGTEYDILHSLMQTNNCVGSTVEFHWIDDESCRDKFKFLIEGLVEYNIVHMHCNNITYPDSIINNIHSSMEFPASCIEITFLRKDMCTTFIKRSQSLLDIDIKNCGCNPEINLIF